MNVLFLLCECCLMEYECVKNLVEEELLSPSGTVVPKTPTVDQFWSVDHMVPGRTRMNYPCFICYLSLSDLVF